MNYKLLTHCRVCQSENLTPYLDLGLMPLSNALLNSPDEYSERYPLKVLLCNDCGLSQLSIIIPPEVMFSHYVYRSSISKGYVDHCRQMAIDLKDTYGLTEKSFHIDIAGNDGALLNEFKKVMHQPGKYKGDGYKCLNVDPAKNLEAINEAQGIRMFCTFWGKAAASHLINTQWPKADLITATNVFAHIADVEEFMEAVKMVLNPTGVLILEFPYLIDFIDNREFDTIYHEHLSYFSVYPITLLCERTGLNVMNVEKKSIHGGSIRVTIGYGEQNKAVSDFVSNERAHYSKIEKYYQFAEDVAFTINQFRYGLAGLKSAGHSIAGFAASAKGCVLLNCAGITGDTMDYIVDQTPEKIGKNSPGTRIPIVDMNELIITPPDYLVILSWNFLSDIKEKCRNLGYKGKFIVGIPEFKIIN